MGRKIISPTTDDSRESENDGEPVAESDEESDAVPE
jgi:hypothetical protein